MYVNHKQTFTEVTTSFTVYTVMYIWTLGKGDLHSQNEPLLCCLIIVHMQIVSIPEASYWKFIIWSGTRGMSSQRKFHNFWRRMRAAFFQYHGPNERIFPSNFEYIFAKYTYLIENFHGYLVQCRHDMCIPVQWIIIKLLHRVGISTSWRRREVYHSDASYFSPETRPLFLAII